MKNTYTCIVFESLPLKDLEMPVVEFKSNAKPSTYGYPAPLEEKKKEDKEKVMNEVPARLK